MFTKKMVMLVASLVFVSLFASVVLAQPVTINFLNFSSSGETVAPHLEKMRQVFEEQNPDIKVNVETVGYGDYFVRLMTSVVGGTAPDAFELNYENFASYANKGVLLDLQPLMEKSGVDTTVINPNALEAFVAQGKQYGLPFSFSNVVVFYNKELFDKAGAEYPTNDWTWDDQLEAAKKITALGPNIFGLYQPIQYWEFYKIVRQNNGSLLNEDMNAFTINAPQNVETLQYMVDRVLKHNVVPTTAQMSGMGDWDMFKAGRIGMVVTGIWAFPDFIRDCDFAWDIAVEPGNVAKATHFFSNGLAISKNSPKAEAAFEWISFLSGSKEVAQIRVDAGWELPAVTYPDVLASYVENTPPASRNIVFDSLAYLVTPPPIEQFNELADIINKHLEEARDGVKTPQEALDAAQLEAEKMIKL